MRPVSLSLVDVDLSDFTIAFVNRYFVVVYVVLSAAILFLCKHRLRITNRDVGQGTTLTVLVHPLHGKGDVLPVNEVAVEIDVLLPVDNEVGTSLVLATPRNSSISA